MDSEQKNSSILASLPSLHGTILSIIVGFFSAYALYAYQTTNSAKENLEYIKRQVQNISQPSFEVLIDKAEYINGDGKLDWKQVKDDLRHASALFGHLDSERYGFPHRETVVVDDELEYYKEHGLARDTSLILKSEIEASARKVLGLTGIIMTSYPYLGKGTLYKSENVDIEDVDSWVEDLDRYTSYLSQVWNSSNRSLSELMSQYRRLGIQRQIERNEKSLQLAIKRSEEQGNPLTDEEISQIRKEFHIVLDTDYSLILRDFFLKVLHLQQQIIPKAQESLIVLTTYKNQFKIKLRLMYVLIGAVFIFILGILTPMVIVAYVKPSILRRLELPLLLVTTAPYLVGLLYLIIVVSRLKQP